MSAKLTAGGDVKGDAARKSRHEIFERTIRNSADANTVCHTRSSSWSNCSQHFVTS